MSNAGRLAQQLIGQHVPTALQLNNVGAWRGAYVANLNTTAANWLAGTTPYETWLSNYTDAPVKIKQALGYCDTGDWNFAGNAAFPIMSVWRSLLVTRPDLMLRLAIPMVPHDTDWDILLAGTHDSVFQSINDSIVLHNNTDAPGSAALIRLRIGWEGNGDWYAWGHHPVANGFTGSTYSTVKWRQGWRRIAGLFAGCRALGTKLVYNPALPFKNVSWGTQWPGLDDDGVTVVPAYDALVDVIGGDAYDQWLGGPSISAATRWAAMYSASNGILSLQNFSAAKNKPVSFDEWGVDLRLSDASNPTKPSGDDFYYINQIAAQMQILIDANRFDGHVYWESNSAIQSKLSTSVISPLSQPAFKAIWGNP